MTNSCTEIYLQIKAKSLARDSSKKNLLWLRIVIASTSSKILKTITNFMTEHTVQSGKNEQFCLNYRIPLCASSSQFLPLMMMPEGPKAVYSYTTLVILKAKTETTLV